MAYIFKMTELIYVIFGTIQHGVVLSTLVKSILNKYVAIKSTTLVFTCTTQAIPLHPNSHIFKIPAHTIFGTTERQSHDILNMPISQQFVQTSSAKHAKIPLIIR